jgi:hypothetical protein
MVADTCNPSTWEVKAGGSRLLCQPVLLNKTMWEAMGKGKRGRLSWFREGYLESYFLVLTFCFVLK